MVWTLSEKIVNAVGTGEDPTELDNLEAQSAVLGSLTASAAELNYLDITTLGTGAASKAVVLDSGDDYTWPATGILTYGVLKDPAGTTLGATVVELNAAADGSANTAVIAAGGAAMTVLTGGGTYMIPLVTANATITLPTATLGQKHRFVFIGSAADAEDWVITSPTLFVGGVGFFDVGGTNAAVYANGSSHLVLTVNNPAAGTDITFIGDGTNWAVTGIVSSADAPAFT